MNEPYPGGPGSGYQPDPGERRQPDDEWFRPKHGQEGGPDPGEASGARGREGYRYRRGHHRRPDPDETLVDQIIALDPVMPDQTAALDPQEGKSGRNWPPISRNWPPIDLNWTLISQNWALIAGIVFFLFDTFLMADGFARPVGAASRLLVIFIWVISLVAVALLWLRGTSRFSIQNPFVRAETDAHPDGDQG